MQSHNKRANNNRSADTAPACAAGMPKPIRATRRDIMGRNTELVAAKNKGTTRRNTAAIVPQQSWSASKGGVKVIGVQKDVS